MATNDKPSSHKTVEDTFAVPPADSQPAPQRPHGVNSTTIAVAIGAGVILLLVGAMAGFVGSRIFSHGDLDDRGGMMMRRQSQRIGLPGRMMGGTYGKVTSVSSSSITLTDNRSGGSVTFKIDSNTDINDNKGDNAKVSDIKVGDTVSVRGTSATDDTTADTIVINPTAPY